MDMVEIIQKFVAGELPEGKIFTQKFESGAKKTVKYVPYCGGYLDIEYYNKNGGKESSSNQCLFKRDLSGTFE